MVDYSISFIGAGKLAAAFCMELFRRGYKINHIISETGISAATLAKKCNATWSEKLSIPDNTDIVIVAIPDKSLGEVLRKVTYRNDVIFAHTAGSHGLEVFENRFLHTGVIYPLQTFTEGRIIDFKEVPFFIEASDSTSATILESIGKQVGKSVHFADLDSRRMLHISAVFINNFTNHMLAQGKDIAEKAGFSFEEMIPLLNETLKKAIEIGPDKAQTGPAVRHDINTIEKHLELLSFSPELRNIYTEISNSIIKRHNKYNLNGKF